MMIKKASRPHKGPWRSRHEGTGSARTISPVSWPACSNRWNYAKQNTKTHKRKSFIPKLYLSWPSPNIWSAYQTYVAFDPNSITLVRVSIAWHSSPVHFLARLPRSQATICLVILLMRNLVPGDGPRNGRAGEIISQKYLTLSSGFIAIKSRRTPS